MSDTQLSFSFKSNLATSVSNPVLYQTTCYGSIFSLIPSPLYHKDLLLQFFPLTHHINTTHMGIYTEITQDHHARDTGPQKVCYPCSTLSPHFLNNERGCRNQEIKHSTYTKPNTITQTLNHSCPRCLDLSVKPQSITTKAICLQWGTATPL